MIILKHHTIVSETSTCSIQNKEEHKINPQGRKIQSPSEICSGVPSDAWSSRSSKKSYLIWLPMYLPFPIDGWWCKYHHVHWSHCLWLCLPLDCSRHGERYWLDWKYWKNNKNNTMTMDMCLFICFVMKDNSFTFHLIQWMQHQ